MNSGDVLDVPPHLGGHVVSGAERECESLLGGNVSAGDFKNLRNISHLSEAGLGHGLPQLVRQLVDRQLLGHSEGPGDCLEDVVVAVGDGHVLVDVGGVEDVGPGGRDGDGELVSEV